MDDLKLFDPNDAGLSQLLATVHKFSTDICMDFGIAKCAKLTVKRGKVIQTSPLPACECMCIPELDVFGVYHYLGLPEVGGIDHQHCKKAVLSEFERRLRLVWSSLLCGHYKVQATNSFCVPLLIYGFGIIEWTLGEIRQMDVLVHKGKREVCSLHPRSAVECVYLPH